MTKIAEVFGHGAAATPPKIAKRVRHNDVFSEILEKKRGDTPRASTNQTVINVLDRFVNDWSKVNHTTQQALAKVPAEHRSLVELQILVNDFNLRANLVSKVGESVTATFNRIQQMGGN